MPTSRHPRTTRVLAAFCLVALVSPIRARQDAPDAAALDRIRGLTLSPGASQVMEIASHLTDHDGPRLTGSPALRRSAEWIVSQMKGWGLDRSELEPWPASTDTANPNNGFPQGWTNEHIALSVEAPHPFPLGGTPVAWTPGTSGPVSGPAVLAPEVTLEELRQRYGGRLKGAWVLGSRVPELRPFSTPLARRYSIEDLDRMVARGQSAGAGRRTGPPTLLRPGPSVTSPFDRYAFFKSEGVLGVLTTTATGHGIYTIGGANRLVDPTTTVPVVMVAAEEYGRVARQLQTGTTITIAGDIRNTFVPNPEMFNVIGEVHGTDKADEVVMLGAHLDSWHAATGATDNAAGAAVMLEVMRVLKRSGLPLRRTLRIGLWTGEEQGLIGSTLYVLQHFGGGQAGANQPTQSVTSEHSALSVYFNLDEGTGSIRGLYLQGNRAIEPVFKQWIEPLSDLGVTHLTQSRTGGTDHVPFDAVGLPAFHFIQDEIEYNTVTHHTNLDTYDRLLAEDMRKNVTVVATMAFLAANREERLPRK